MNAYTKIKEMKALDTDPTTGRDLIYQSYLREGAISVWRTMCADGAISLDALVAYDSRCSARTYIQMKESAAALLARSTDQDLEYVPVGAKGAYTRILPA